MTDWFCTVLESVSIDAYARHIRLAPTTNYVPDISIESSNSALRNYLDEAENSLVHDHLLDTVPYHLPGQKSKYYAMGCMGVRWS